jgi:hypothetical protein
MEMLRLAVDTLRRGTLLIAKRNWAFRLVNFLEIKESIVVRLLERAVAMTPPGTLVEVIQISPDPVAEMGIHVRAMSYDEGMQLLQISAPLCMCGVVRGPAVRGVELRSPVRASPWLSMVNQLVVEKCNLKEVLAKEAGAGELISLPASASPVRASPSRVDWRAASCRYRSRVGTCGDEMPSPT